MKEVGFKPGVLILVIVREYTILVCNQSLGQLSLLPVTGWKKRAGQGTLAVLYGQEGNRRSDVALSMRH